MIALQLLFITGISVGIGFFFGRLDNTDTIRTLKEKNKELLIDLKQKDNNSLN